MIIIGAVTKKGTPLYMCQDTGASLNGTTIAVARKEGLRIIDKDAIFHNSASR